MNFRKAGETRHLFLVLGSFGDFSDKIAHGDVTKVMSGTKELCTGGPTKAAPRSVKWGAGKPYVSDGMWFSRTPRALPPPSLTSPLALHNSLL